MKKWFIALLILAMLGFLLVMPSDALTASRRGLDLWFSTLVPTLLPFLILSGFLIHSGLVRVLASLLYPILGRLFHISPEGSYACFTGFLCGYPVGAKVLGDLSRNHLIHPEEARYLLGFCNNVSPSFVITFLITEQLKEGALLPTTLFILYGMPLLYGFLTRPIYERRKRKVNFTDTKNASTVQINFELLDACIYDAVNTLLKLGGYIILFSVLAEITAHIKILPSSLAAVGTGILEVTNGIPKILNQFPRHIAYRILLPVTAFGGLSSMAQTSSVLKGSGLSMAYYGISKLAVTALTLLAVWWI